MDEAQELTDAQWQMLLRRCSSESFTIVGERAQARHRFTESRLERLGRLGRIGLGAPTVASLGINYQTPLEVMAEAEPVILAALPDAQVPVSVRRSGIGVLHVLHCPAADRGDVLRTWLDAHVDGVACVIGDPAFDAMPRVRSLTAELTKGLELDLVVLVDPSACGLGVGVLPTGTSR